MACAVRVDRRAADGDASSVKKAVGLLCVRLKVMSAYVGTEPVYVWSAARDVTADDSALDSRLMMGSGKMVDEKSWDEGFASAAYAGD